MERNNSDIVNKNNTLIERNYRDIVNKNTTNCTVIYHQSKRKESDLLRYNSR